MEYIVQRFEFNFVSLHVKKAVSLDVGLFAQGQFAYGQFIQIYFLKNPDLT